MKTNKPTQSSATNQIPDLFPSPEVTPTRVICGLKNIADYFHCHPTTVVKNYRRGFYGKSMKRFGKDYVFNPEILWS